MNDTRGEPRNAARLAAIDAIKAAAIVSVVINHSGTALFLGGGSWLDWTIRAGCAPFAVPSFLFVSGFLYARPHPIDVRHIGRRLTRILPPYLIASGVMLVTGMAAPLAPAQIPLALLTGSVVGIYYYVFILCLLVIAMWPISRLSPAALAALAAALFAYLPITFFAPEVRLTETISTSMRNPVSAFQLGYFVVGWLASREFTRLRDWYLSRQPTCHALATFVIVAAVITYATPEMHSFEWQQHMGRTLVRVPFALAMVAGIAMVAHRRESLPRPIILLADATFPIYLYHWIPVKLLEPYVADLAPLARISLTTSIAVTVSLLFFYALRSAFGPRWSRRLLGG